MYHYNIYQLFFHCIGFYLSPYYKYIENDYTRFKRDFWFHKDLHEI